MTVEAEQASQSAKAEAFRALHRPGSPLLLPNPFDAGSARLLAALGFAALATTSSGFAATLGRLDGSVTREESIANAAAIVAATELPVSADLENGFGDAPEAVARTIEAALAVGLAGASVEDWSGRGIYDAGLATERVAAAVEVAAGRLVLTARAENHLHGVADRRDTIDRLRRYEEAGADVLYAPGLTEPGEIREVVSSLERPVNVLLRPGGPTVPELGALGVSRVSIGGAFAYVALAALAEAAGELSGEGPYSFFEAASAGRRLSLEHFAGGLPAGREQGEQR